jgi:hypothetical protein
VIAVESERQDLIDQMDKTGKIDPAYRENVFFLKNDCFMGRH